jgi:hypothetical protein
MYNEPVTYRGYTINSVGINVKYHDERRHIEDICLLCRDENVIVLHVNMRTKNKPVSAYGGATDEGVQSIWIGFNEIQLSLPEDFKDNCVASECSRYTIYITIFKHKLLEDMCQSGSKDDVCLWEDVNWDENNESESSRG